MRVLCDYMSYTGLNWYSAAAKQKTAQISDRRRYRTLYPWKDGNLGKQHLYKLHCRREARKCKTSLLRMPGSSRTNVFLTWEKGSRKDSFWSWTKLEELNHYLYRILQEDRNCSSIIIWGFLGFPRSHGGDSQWTSWPYADNFER